ncbi:AcrR family transcriptional regulator [Amycolatopsis bartoniae]|uniref:TetR family transcriptional regulator n=1 Tax=Amycolatopsis bartoniae TaxID=941986 RepID=A0A8H9M9W0_9PSEU|nr:TetR/AcrR family transcriptional regulator [Amycolatopsis bartoniae]MBB2940006.1 AcrR family transcriptional regulator [Amycolatopsis bartoniae]TVT09972.1 TetR/AcrR family transcriptional regulator [Amycolatopsis bartoniae]GHF32061.1 TetR family transcriptional regulator [Amycolatopsis bartoniae]
MARTHSSLSDGEFARRRILDAAHAVFAARGFRAATVDAIARRSELSRAGVLHHFANKQAILTALLDERDAELALDEDAVADSVATLIAGVRARLRRILGQRDLILLAHALRAEAVDPEHPAHDWLVRRSRRLRAAMTTALEASAARGELRSDVDPRLLAALLLAVIEGLEMQWLEDPGEIDVEAGVALFDELLRGSIAAHL